MRYYIINPRSVEKDPRLIDGIRKADPEAEMTDTLEECDIAVL